MVLISEVVGDCGGGGVGCGNCGFRHSFSSWGLLFLYLTSKTFVGLSNSQRGFFLLEWQPAQNIETYRRAPPIRYCTYHKDYGKL